MRVFAVPSGPDGVIRSLWDTPLAMGWADGGTSENAKRTQRVGRGPEPRRGPWGGGKAGGIWLGLRSLGL